ncbi:MAG: hypothetical protein U0324_30910 [Polyangiales bacterium]
MSTETDPLMRPAATLPRRLRALFTATAFAVPLLIPAPTSAQVTAPAAAPTAMEALAPTDARVMFVRGPVEVLTPTARPLAAGEVLHRGMRVRTGAHAQATIALPNGSTVDLEENGLLTLFTAPGARTDDPLSTTTTLTRGTARVRQGAAGLRATPIPVQTEALTVWAGRADAMIAADLGGNVTRLAVWRGRMRVRVGTREYLLTQGYGVQEESGHGPGVLRLLPRAPVWRAAPPPRVLTFGEPIDVQAMWSPNPRAAQANPASEWKVQLARDDAFHDLVVNDRVPVATTSYTGRRLAPGTYHMRVVAVDINRFESAASPVARVEIAAPTVIPAADAPEGRRAAIRIPDGFYCGLDGAALAAHGAPIVLHPGRPHTLRCALNPRGRDARDHVIPAGLAGPLRREVRVDPPAADSDDGPATGVLSLRLRDSAGEPVSLARVEASATDGVTVDPVRETDQRGVYTATVRWPRGVRATRVRFTINEALQFDQDARVDRVQVVPPRPAAQAARAPAPPVVEVIRMAPPRDPEDDERVNPEE